MATGTIVTKRDGSRFSLVSAERKSTIMQGEQRIELLGEDVVTMNVVSATPLNFDIGDTVEVYGQVYTMNALPEMTKRGNRVFAYGLVFEGVQYELLKAQYLDLDEQGLALSGDFYLMATLRGFCEMLVRNANRAQPGRWSLADDCPETDSRNLSFSEEKCLPVLQRVCEEFGFEFWITIANDGTNCINIGTVGSELPHEFAYGRGKGLYELKRQTVDSENIVTRLYAFGADKNLKSDYRGYSRRLKPFGVEYLEDATAQGLYGIIEATKNWDDIYPRRKGKVTGVISGNVLSFVDATMGGESGFNLNESDANGTKWLIAGTAAKIAFTSGNLAGYDFDLRDPNGYNHSTNTFVIVPFNDERGQVFPDEKTEAFQFNVGDEYVMYDIMMPDSYIANAENELLEAAQEYLSDNKHPRVSYECVLDELYLRRKAGSGTVGNVFSAGDYVTVRDASMNIDGTVRIQGFTRDLISPYKYSLTLSDFMQVTRQDRLIADTADIKRVIQVNRLNNPERVREGWRTLQETLDMVFDADGYFDADRIKPLSIETSMLAVGAKSGQFTLDVIIEPNYNRLPNSVNITGGTLVHLTIEENPRTWDIQSSSITLDSASTAYYIYVRCPKEQGIQGYVYFSTEYIMVDEDLTYYHFLIGILHSVSSDGLRWITSTYGATSINGRFIKTGRIQSADGRTWFDLDTGEISGAIKFLSSGGGYRDVEDVEAAANSAATVATQASVAAHAAQNAVDNIEIGGRNLLPNSELTHNSGLFTANQNVTLSNPNNEYLRVVCNQDNSTPGIIINPLSKFSSFPFNKEFIVSFDARGFDGTTGIYVLVSPNYVFVDLTDSFQRVNVKCSPVTDAPFFLLFFPNPAVGHGFDIRNVKIELGNKPTDWSPAPEDVQAAVTAAQTIAQAAQLTVNTEKLRLDEWASDGFISPTEKTGLKQQQSDIQSEYNEIDSQATLYALKSSAEWTQYNSAYTSANAAFNKYTATTPETITITSDYANIADYYPKRQAILDLIAVKANNFASKRDNNLLKPENLRISQGTSIAPEDYLDFCNSLNGNPSENLIVSGEGPFGSTVKLWKCISDGDNNADGGWDKAGNFVADLNETYRFCVFVKKNSGDTYSYAYSGVNTNGAIKNINGSVNNNPYFASFRPAIGRWYLIVGHVFPINTPNNPPSTSGVYDVLTGKKENIDVYDFAFSGSTDIIWHRAYQYYALDPGTVMYFYAPMVHKCDGTEPSIATILGLDAKAQAQLSDIAADNKLTPSEKRSVILEWESIQKEFPIIESESYMYSEAMPTVLFEARRAGQTGTPDILVVPETGRYRITAMGAAGSASDSRNLPANAGYTGGKGAEVSAEFDLQAGDVLTFVVGKMGTRIDAPTAPTDGVGGMGGGGTFVFKNIAAITDSRYQFTKNGQAFEVLLVAAGGGGTTDLNYSASPLNGTDGLGTSYSPSNYQAPNATTFSGSTSSSQPYGGSIQQYISNNAIGGYYSRGGNQGRGGYGGGAIADDARSSGGGWYSDGVQAYSWSAGLYTEGKTGVNAGNGRVTAGLRKYNIDSGDYLASYSDLMLYLTPLLSDLETTSDIDGLTFRMKFLSYYSSRQALLNAIENERGGRISDAQIAALSANSLAMSQAYIEEALRNDTTIDGGLLSTTLIKVGSTSDGEWIEKAGINGADIGENVVRFYAGGTLTEAIKLVAGVASDAKFAVTQGGRLFATNAEISGKINATSGIIGGWTIANDMIHAGNPNTGTVLSPTRIEVRGMFSYGGSTCQLLLDSGAANVGEQLILKGSAGVKIKIDTLGSKETGIDIKTGTLGTGLSITGQGTAMDVVGNCYFENGVYIKKVASGIGSMNTNLYINNLPVYLNIYSPNTNYYELLVLRQ